MTGKVALVTQGTSGVGKEAALALARLGATVLVVGRNRQGGEDVLDSASLRSTLGRIELVLADLSSQAEVRRVAALVAERYGRLDVLVHNACEVFRKRRTTVDGIEMTLAVDHLAPFLLTNLLLAELRAAAPSRVVTVSWDARRRGAIDFEDLHARGRFSAARASAQARLANELFTAELAERLEGTGVIANAVVQRTKLRFRRIAADSADGVIRLAVAPDHASLTGTSTERGHRPRPIVADPAARRRLWEVSAHLTGLTALSTDWWTPSPSSDGHAVPPRQPRGRRRRREP